MDSRTTLEVHPESRYIISMGFGVILFLALAICITGYTRLASLKVEIDTSSNEYHVKADILNHLKQIVSDRSLAMYNMATLQDPFELDDEYIRYNKLAGEFVRLREHLESLPMSSEELTIYHQLLELVRQAQPNQDAIVNLYIDDKRHLISRDMILADWVSEQELGDKFTQITSLQNLLTQNSLNRANRSYEQALDLLILLTSITILIGLIVARHVVRHASKIENDLFRQKAQAEITLQAIGDAVITTDTENKIRYINPIAEKMLGCRLSDVFSKPISTLVRFFDKNNIHIDLAEYVTPLRQTPLKLADASIRNVGSSLEFAIEGSASLIHNERNDVAGKVIIFRDVSENKNLEERLTWQATHDELTGLVNRREFENLVRKLLDDAHTNHRSHALLYIDLDQFKVVNDTCGHIAGDMLLQQLTVVLQKQVRGSDTICRLGGDEFGVLLESCSLEKAKSIASDLLSTIQEFRFAWKSYVFKVGASIGAVTIDNNAENVSTVLSNADSACYLAKEKGRNRIWVHYANDQEIAQRHGEMALTSLINKALENDRFSIYKQRIEPMDKSNGAIYELLIRMHNEKDETILPMAFIPAAERYSIMPKIDRWMISTALKRISKQLNIFDDVEMVSINLSGQSLSQEHFQDFVVSEIKNATFGAEKICFEITETAAIANWQQVNQFIDTLTQMGCKFALDDFGSGMSSFTYLRNFSVDYIKIDGSFVRNINNDAVNREMVRSIHNLGKVMNIQTIAEYVESDEVLKELSTLGINFAQGFRIHQPDPL